MEEIIKNIKHFLKVVNRIAEKILLHVAYLLAIGLTSFISKVIEKDFLDITSKKTNWKNSSASLEIEKMY